MKITINGTISKEALKTILQTQKEKVEVIDTFCKENHLTQFYYKDSEMEYAIESKPSKPKIEVRSHD